MEPETPVAILCSYLSCCARFSQSAFRSGVAMDPPRDTGKACGSRVGSDPDSFTDESFYRLHARLWPLPATITAPHCLFDVPVSTRLHAHLVMHCHLTPQHALLFRTDAPPLIQCMAGLVLAHASATPSTRPPCCSSHAPRQQTRSGAWRAPPTP